MGSVSLLPARSATEYEYGFCSGKNGYKPRLCILMCVNQDLLLFRSAHAERQRKLKNWWTLPKQRVERNDCNYVETTVRWFNEQLSLKVLKANIIRSRVIGEIEDREVFDPILSEYIWTRALFVHVPMDKKFFHPSESKDVSGSTYISSLAQLDEIMGEVAVHYPEEYRHTRTIVEKACRLGLLGWNSIMKK